MNHVFVDFENVPSVDLSALGDQDAEVTLLIGEKQRRLELALVRQIHAHATKVTLVEVGASGRNALDLVLAWHLGKTAERHPDDFYFVVSRDKDFNPLLAHLRTRGLQVERVDSFTQLPFLAPPARGRQPGRPRRVRRTAAMNPAAHSAAGSPLRGAPQPPAAPPRDERLEKLIDRLQNRTKARPARRKTLRSHIQQFFGHHLAEPELDAVAATLEERGILRIDPADRVTYP